MEEDPNLLVGRETSDDAGVYRLTDELALVQTIDFITPVVNDPYDFGRIAAANALSDVYAMGGRPLTAMNVVCFPVKSLDKAILKEILRGGLEKTHEAGAVLAGGHSVEDPEIKYGLSVTGTVHPDRILTNAGVRPGDALILTKPLGTGILATAIKAELVSEEGEKLAIETMATLNRRAAEVMAAYPVHACTDVTGFGLLGHALEMAAASNVSITIEAERVPLLPEALDLLQLGLLPAGSYANRSFCAHRVLQTEPLDPLLLDLLADAQTSGGLLISLPEEDADSLVGALKAGGVPRAAIIGRATRADKGSIQLMRRA
ncbi:selenophosphate synthase [Syntrophobacter fumaroxidans MPOB]|uniref:Selenide, water dikinase n=2 Tax=Syntrophobacter TaxID=29526 RepID=A0LNS2_SYNFM|nr:selenophosphate synthase [Syntrophobacter fumaroxidans MPOB]